MKTISARAQSVLTLLVPLAVLVIGFRLSDGASGWSGKLVVAVGTGIVAGVSSLLVSLWARSRDE